MTSATRFWRFAGFWPLSGEFVSTRIAPLFSLLLLFPPPAPAPAPPPPPTKLDMHLVFVSGGCSRGISSTDLIWECRESALQARLRACCCEEEGGGEDEQLTSSRSSFSGDEDKSFESTMLSHSAFRELFPRDVLCVVCLCVCRSLCLSLTASAGHSP